MARKSSPLAFRVGIVLMLVTASVWTGSVGCLKLAEEELVFRARRSRVVAPVAYDNLFRLSTGGGISIDAVAMPAAAPSEYWILFCPPAAGTIHGRLRSQLEALQAFGYNVLAFDYRGFGRNDGAPSEAGVYADALAAYRHLTGPYGVPPSRVILAGRSLGSAVAIELATQVPSAGLLLLSAIDSVPSTASRLYPWAPVRLLASYRFDSLSKAPAVKVPVLLVHGLNDRLVPLEAAKALFDLFPADKLMLATGAGHNSAGFGAAITRTGAPLQMDLAEALDRFWPRTRSRSGSG